MKTVGITSKSFCGIVLKRIVALGFGLFVFLSVITSKYLMYIFFILKSLINIQIYKIILRSNESRIKRKIIEQLLEAINLAEGYKVSALIDDEQDNKIVGLTVVKVYDDGIIKSVNKNFDNLKELINMYI